MACSDDKKFDPKYSDDVSSFLGDLLVKKTIEEVNAELSNSTMTSLLKNIAASEMRDLDGKLREMEDVFYFDEVAEIAESEARKQGEAQARKALDGRPILTGELRHSIVATQTCVETRVAAPTNEQIAAALDELSDVAERTRTAESQALDAIVGAFDDVVKANRRASNVRTELFIPKNKKFL